VRTSSDGELYMTQNAWIIVAGIFSGVLISYLYVFLLKTYPRPMVYFMIVLSMTVIGIFALVGLFTANMGLFIGMAVTFLIYGLVLYCLRKKLETGIAMVTVATRFIT